MPIRSRNLGLPGALLLVIAASGARAEARAADAPLRERSLAWAAEQPAPQPPGQALDFELLSPARNAPSAADVARVEHAVRTRRTMLQVHQALGITTLVALAATDVVGQLDFDNKFRGGGDTGAYLPWHASLAGVTTALFATTALLALTAPTPYPKPLRLDPLLFHKVFMGLAAAGMVAEVVLGLLTHGHEGSLSQRDYASWHQALGYATFGGMAAGTTALVF